MNNDDWIDGTWHTAQEDSLFARLSEEQCSTLLDAMVNRHSIDFRVANILKAVSKRHHKLVIEWFGKRIANSERESVNDFTPIPFAFHDLDKVLRPYAGDILVALRSWYDDPKITRSWQAERLLSRIYPGFESPLPETLERVVSSGDPDTLLFPTHVLIGFEGRENFLSFLRDILRSQFATDEVENAVELLVLETGVLKGDLGAAETYRKKIALLTSWLKDDAERVSAFARKQIPDLENMVAFETRRAQQQIALRHLEFDEDIGGNHGEDDSGDR